METQNTQEDVGGHDQTGRAEVRHEIVHVDPTHQSGDGEPSAHTRHCGFDPNRITNQRGGTMSLANNPIIPKVPKFIREKYNSEDYDPLVASFRPYHGMLRETPHDHRLKFVEDFKSTALSWFILGTEKDLNGWLTIAWELAPNLRHCYAQGSTDKFNDPQFALMMFQEAILIMGVANQECSDIDLLNNHLGAATVVTIIRDSFLLENQIPFRFIRTLIHNKFGIFKGEARWQTHLYVSCHGIQSGNNSTEFWDKEARDPSHFVEALKITHLSGIKGETNMAAAKSIATKDGIKEEVVVSFKDYYAMHSVTELKAKGIYVEPNPTNSFKNITFQSGWFNGTLQLPVDYVNYSTRAAYSNIIAYEMTPVNGTQDYIMTSYVHLMKSLLQTPKDVEELQANGTILNMVGSNEEVVNLYRGIYTFGTN